MSIFGSGGSGANPDNETIETNTANELKVKPSVASVSETSLSSITYSTNTTLTADVYADDVTIDSSVTLTTNGYNIYCSGTFTNSGTIDTGTNANTNTEPPVNYPDSYGGSGGGSSTSNSTKAGSGSTPTAPTITNTLINNMYLLGMNNCLTGANGAGSPNTSTPYNGGSTIASGGALESGTSGVYTGNGTSGANGIYIQADTIIAGTINANGGDSTIPGLGSGGGGAILLAYGSGGYTAGTYSYLGGSNSSGGLGGSGGSGQLLTYNYSTAPITIPEFSSTKITSSSINQNRLSNYNYQDSNQSLSSTPSTIGTSISITPSNSGLLIIHALVSASNTTIGNTTTISLFNGTTLLNSKSYTQEGVASNSHTFDLYYEDTYTLNTSTTFSIQISGQGTANYKIDLFQVYEVY